MSLPKLPDLNGLEIEESPPKKERVNKSNIESQKFDETLDETHEEEVNERPKIPKSQYDDSGKPILLIPDLDDTELNDEIERFFGD